MASGVLQQRQLQQRSMQKTAGSFALADRDAAKLLTHLSILRRSLRAMLHLLFFRPMGCATACSVVLFVLGLDSILGYPYLINDTTFYLRFAIMVPWIEFCKNHAS